MPLPSDNAELIALLERLISELEHDRREHRRRLDRITENLRSFENRVFTIENSRVVRMLQHTSAFLRVMKRRAAALGKATEHIGWLSGRRRSIG